jgi:mono/diheme cytochrome c family protein
MKRMLTGLVAAALVVGAASAQAAAQEAKGKGIGPVKDLKLGPIDAQMVEAGRKTYEAKCGMCHSLDAKKMGPPLRDVTDRRAPEWIMNLLLNLSDMLANDPEASQMVGQYRLRMPNPQLKEDDARQILEYLRQAAREKPAP